MERVCVQSQRRLFPLCGGRCSIAIASVLQCMNMVRSSLASGVKEFGVMLWWTMFLFMLGEAITDTFSTLLL